MYMCICVYVYMCICIHVYMYTCIYVYLYVCIGVYVYVYEESLAHANTRFSYVLGGFVVYKYCLCLCAYMYTCVSHMCPNMNICIGGRLAIIACVLLLLCIGGRLENGRDDIQ